MSDVREAVEEWFETHWRVALAALVALSVLWQIYLFRDSILSVGIDDTFIGVRYAKNFADGNGFVFNVGGERVDQVSAYLIVFLWALVYRLGAQDLGVAASVLEMVLSVGVLGMTYMLGRLVVRERLYVFLGIVFLAASGPFAFYSVAGMGAMLYALVTLSALYLYLTEKGATPRVVATAAVLGLAPVAHYIGFLLAGFVLLVDLLLTYRGDSTWTRWLLRLAVFALVASPVFIWKTLYFGELLPYTYTIKSTATVQWYGPRPNLVVQEFLSYYAPVILLFAIGIVSLAATTPRSDRLRQHLILLTWAVVSFAIAVFGLYYVYSRYFLHVIPIFALYAALGAKALATRPLVKSFGLHVLVGIVVVVLVFDGWRDFKLAETWSQQSSEQAVRVEVGEWLRDNSPSNATVLSGDYAAIGYRSDRTIIDPLASLSKTGLAYATQGRYTEYIIAAKPDYAVFVAGKDKGVLDDELARGLQVSVKKEKLWEVVYRKDGGRFTFWVCRFLWD